jgi:hypothetical protein
MCAAPSEPRRSRLARPLLSRGLDSNRPAPAMTSKAEPTDAPRPDARRVLRTLLPLMLATADTDDRSFRHRLG